MHNNTAAEGGGIAFTFNPVIGDAGISKTNVAALDDGSAFGFADVLSFDGYINVHLSADDLATLVAQGDIGQNELTGESIAYDLAEKDVAGISGTALFEERVNGTTLVTIQLTGTPEGGSHPAHIHENDIATTGPIIVGLTSVNGDTGLSKTQVSELVGGAQVSYTDLLTANAYINVHLSNDDLATIVAQGNIGSNVGDGNESKTYDVVNDGATAYVFNGEELTDFSNPDLTLKRGSTYTFNIDAPGHPFLIKEVQGPGTMDLYNEGVTDNGAVAGAVTFTVPADAPDILYYNCEFHASMTGTFTIVD
ncbi:CHRD domain-containing protein [Muriicola soli]|uniref:CHRD domain-containing protein n=1 Tax=Muriicola soli TaxID=2507538 RepID=A0A411EDI1_9FLAO|nr:CHRD domain-containing protein [Muriicola soli]